MINISNKHHISTVIKSLENIYNKSKIYGKLYPKDINYLNIIYKLLNSCYLDLTVSDIQQLIDIYNKIENNSNYICSSTIYPKHIQTKNNFVQAESKDCNELPVINKIYYWFNREFWEPDYDLSVVEEATNTTFLFSQLFKTYEQFSEGFEIPLESGDSRVICINVYQVQPNTDYKLYNELNEDITSLFYFHYIEETNSFLYVGKIYLNALEYIKLIKTN